VATPFGTKQVKMTDAFGELTSVKHSNSIGVALWTETFGYDGMGNIQQIVENGVNSEFQYDGLNRIQKEQLPTGTKDYAYDAFGNISFFTSSDSTDNGPDFTQAFYSYNALNQLSSLSKGTTNASYTYYGDGLRATKTVNGAKTRYIYLDGRVIEELDANGNTIGRNIWGNELLYRKDAVQNKAGYYMYNGHGDVIAIRDSSGVVLNAYDYDIWGKIITQTEQMSNPFQYTGEIYDDESGLIYLRARYYDPNDRRFISEDTYEG
ncbi:RHS repeat protein, partial [Paenibacillus sp. MMS18-CY102]|nr:RHS repeat protein [Paenibacillus sp. MMS18-CY102]